jgi:hypothetical protein
MTASMIAMVTKGFRVRSFSPLMFVPDISSPRHRIATSIPHTPLPRPKYMEITVGQAVYSIFLPYFGHKLGITLQKGYSYDRKIRDNVIITML